MTNVDLWTGPPCRVLVLDDDNLIVRAVSRSLRLHGLTVETTTTAEEALAAARREQPTIVVSDLHMPGSCGAQLLASMQTVAPDAMRVLMSADPNFVPKRGTLSEARVHSLWSKSNLGSLASLVLSLLRGRFGAAETPEERETLALFVAHRLGRPQEEDDAHRRRTSVWASHVATMMDLPSEEVEQARLGAILHDVGNITVPQPMFARAGELEPEERSQLEAHPSAGARIVDAMPALRRALQVVGSHHERQDGSGYPEGLTGMAIPAAARAFQVVDAYDAITRGRPYAAARSHREAIAELSALAGHQHDAHAVDALASLGEEGLARATAAAER